MPRSTLPSEDCVFRLNSGNGYRSEFPVTYNDVGLSSDGFEFDGSNSVIDCGSLPNTTAISVESIITPSDIDGFKHIISKYGGSGFQQFTFAQNGSLLYFYINSGSSSNRILYDFEEVKTMHVICTFDSLTNEQKMYVNGSLVAEQTLDVDLINPDINLYIGSSVEFDLKFGGIIPFVSIYKKALTAQEAIDRYNKVTFRVE